MKSKLRRRTDNMPEKFTAHAVRRLALCNLCGGLGDRTLMILGESHTSCFSKKYGFKGIDALDAQDIAKLRLNDISGLSQKQKNALFAKAGSK